jgi:hypothetical protein
MPELIELTGEELELVAGGVSLTGTNATGFSAGIGTSVNSSADATHSVTVATNGGAAAAAFLASFTLAASPPGS